MLQTLTRRDFLKVGAGTLASASILSLVGCGASSSGSAGGVTQLQMVYWGPASRAQLTNKAISLFEKTYPHLTISSQYSDWSAYWNKLATEIAGGNEPDIIQMDMAYIAQYVQKGLLLNLTSYIPKPINLSDFNQILLRDAEVNNTVYGIPMGGNFQAMFYDTVMLDKAGVQPPDSSMTWETFATFATKVSQALGKGFYGTPDASGNYVPFEVFIRQRGKEVYTSDGKLNVNQQDMVDWFTYWSELRKAGACPPASVTAAYADTGPASSVLIAGKAPIEFSWSNLIEAYQQATPHKLGMAVYPQGVAGSALGMYLKASMLISASAATKHPEDAASFINFVTNNTSSVKALGLDRGVPGSAHARAVLQPLLSAVEQEEVAYFDAASAYARPKQVLDPAAAGQNQLTLTRISQEVAFGQLSISAGASRFLAQVTQALQQ